MRLSKMQLEDIEAEYNSKFYPIKKLFFDRINCSLSMVNIKGNNKVLEIGCGSGKLLQIIRKKHPGCELYGIDINLNIKNLKIPNCHFKTSDAKNLPFKDNFFDVVFALDVLEHIKDAQKAILEIKRVLKPGGFFVVSGPTENFFHKFARFLTKGTFYLKGIHYYSIYQLKSLIIRNEFKMLLKAKKLPAYCPPIVLIFAFKNIKLRSTFS